MYNNKLYYIIAFNLFISAANAEEAPVAETAAAENITPEAIAPEAAKSESAALEAAKPDTTALENEVLNAINKERKQNNLSELKFNDKLMTISREHSVAMAAAGKAGHELNGSTMQSRINKIGYKIKKVGENIAMVGRSKNSPEEDAKEVTKMWMNSQAHRANILMGDFTEVGVGYAVASNGNIYYTTVFGTS